MYAYIANASALCFSPFFFPKPFLFPAASGYRLAWALHHGQVTEDRARLMLLFFQFLPVRRTLATGRADLNARDFSPLPLSSLLRVRFFT